MSETKPDDSQPNPGGADEFDKEIHRAAYGLVGLHEEEQAYITKGLIEDAVLDRLTRLPNEQFFKFRVAEAIKELERTGVGFSGLYVDLDGLKKINDNLGHKAGDEYIFKAAQALDSSVRVEKKGADEENRDNQKRETDLIAFRLHGDEFAVLLTGVDDPTELDKIKKRITEKLASAQIPASMAGKVYEHGQTVEEFIHIIDEMMYQEKKARRLEKMKEEGEGPGVSFS